MKYEIYNVDSKTVKKPDDKCVFTQINKKTHFFDLTNL